MKRTTFVGLGIGSAFLAALATSTIRDSMGIANSSLLLAAIIVAAALVDWAAGIATALVAAVALNYFHTEPVHSLRITDTSDLIAVALLAGLGIAVSAATAFRVSERVREYHSSVSRGAIAALARARRSDLPAAALWHAVVDAECTELALLDARIVTTGTERLPVIARRSTGPDETGSDHELVTIPSSGAVVVLKDPRLGVDVVLTPRDRNESTELRRSTVFMFVDNIELAISRN